jgi:PAS domain S-box-containing protein
MQKQMYMHYLNRILVVDDTTANLQLLTRLLTAHGYTVHPASDGELALEFVRSTLPDLILLDIRMPGMDGYEVCRRLKADKRTHSIPVIFISILEDECNKIKGFQAGAVDYITKPFQAEEVLARVRIHLHLRELTEHLEQKVSERTEELHTANAQLQHELAERIQVEERLRVSEERLRLTLEATQIGIFDWDVLKDRWYASPEYYTMLGYEAKDGMEDRSEWLAKMHPHDRPQVEAKIKEVLARAPSADRSDAYAYEARIRHADGSYRWHIVKGLGVKRDAQGSVKRMLGIRMDITERKATEEALRQLNMELDRRVLDRTAQLEAANKELEAFAYTVSHDLRAPLRHIDGYLQLLQKRAETALDDQSRHYMDAISDTVINMGQLIDDLLAFSRMGRHTLSFQQVDLGKLVGDVIRELEPDAAGRNIDWCIGDLPMVSGDTAMLRMVLGNLIANALKFTRPRQQARIEIGSLPGQNQETVIFLRDNGVGFDMAYGDKLFGVFQRLHHTDEFEGTGIGLANVRRLIARHGGRTWAKGKVDQGATFYFSLPNTTRQSH